MSPVDAFLVFSALSYLITLFFAQRLLKNIPQWAEKLLMLIWGWMLLLNLVFDVHLVWLFYGFGWTVAMALSYLGITHYDEDKRVFALWDALIAICCLTKF